MFCLLLSKVMYANAVGTIPTYLAKVSTKCSINGSLIHAKLGLINKNESVIFSHNPKATCYSS